MEELRRKGDVRLQQREEKRAKREREDDEEGLVEASHPEAIRLWKELKRMAPEVKDEDYRKGPKRKWWLADLREDVQVYKSRAMQVTQNVEQAMQATQTSEQKERQETPALAQAQADDRQSGAR
eukprot:2786792-Amphidinium_carterae.1